MDCWSSSCSKAALLNSLADGSRTCWRCRAFGGFRTGVLEERRPSSSSCSNAVLLLPRSWLMNSQQITYITDPNVTRQQKSNRFNGIDHLRMSALHHACLAIHQSKICYSHENKNFFHSFHKFQPSHHLLFSRTASYIHARTRKMTGQNEHDTLHHASYFFFFDLEM